MGSLFMVVVPIREFEFRLRQKEQNIRIIQDGIVTDEQGRSLSVGSNTSLNLPPPIAGSTHTSMTMSSSGSDVSKKNVYTAMVDGREAQLILSADSMTVLRKNFNLDKFDEPVVSKPGPGTPTGSKKTSSATASELKLTVDSIFLEKHLEDQLGKFNIMTACWGQSVDGNYSQVAFTVKSESQEKIINALQIVGIGIKYKSSLCVCSASVYYDAIDAKKQQDDEEDQDEQQKKNKWNQFVASIKSRLTVAQVVQTVKANAVMTFDYIVLIIVAGMIAGLGLVDDSSVNVVASMLVSPLMGPIMATTFGAVIRDKDLIKIGLTNELIGLAICLVWGFLFGLCLQLQLVAGPWAKVEKWPTDQMRGRSELRGLIVGVMVAIPSGAGVALSILAGNSGSLVGVAISASLLPPAVNCGIFWGMASIIAIGNKNRTHSDYTTKFTSIYDKDDIVKEYAHMGIISFCLTLINIVIIFTVGTLILKIKEVAPHTTRTSLQRFFKEDLKAARRANVQGRNVMSEVDHTENKEALLKALETDQTFNTVNRRNPFGSGGTIMHDLKHRKKAPGSPPTEKPSKMDNAANTAGSGWGGWLGGLFGGRSEQEYPNTSSSATGGTSPNTTKSRANFKPRKV